MATFGTNGQPLSIGSQWGQPNPWPPCYILGTRAQVPAERLTPSHIPTGYRGTTLGVAGLVAGPPGVAPGGGGDTPLLADALVTLAVHKEPVFDPLDR